MKGKELFIFDSLWCIKNMYLENVFCSFQVGLACRRSQIYFVISKAHEYHALSDLSFFGRGLLAESVNKDTMVKLTLSLSNL